MKFKIDFAKAASDPLHPLRIIILIALFSAGVYSLEKWFILKSDWGQAPWRPVYGLALHASQPQLISAGIRIQEGIDRWRGNPENRHWRAELTILLALLVFSFVLGPALFVWGLRARARWYRYLPARRGTVRIATALAIGGFVVISQASTLILAFQSQSRFNTMLEDNTSAAERDAMSTELIQTATNAQVLYFLPKSEGGCGMSWLAPHASGRPAITLSDIRPAKLPTSKVTERAFPQKPKIYVLEVYRSDSLSILGTGNSPAFLAQDDASQNNNPQLKRIQQRVDVTPDRVKATYIR
jgi:hypothetical protein